MTLIGQRIKQYRKEKGYSLSELAEKAGVAKSYLRLNRTKSTNEPLHSISRKSLRCSGRLGSYFAR